MMAIKSRYSFLDFVQIARSIAKSISLRDVDSNEIIRMVVEERYPKCEGEISSLDFYSFGNT